MVEKSKCILARHSPNTDRTSLIVPRVCIYVGWRTRANGPEWVETMQSSHFRASFVLYSAISYWVDGEWISERRNRKDAADERFRNQHHIIGLHQELLLQTTTDPSNFEPITSRLSMDLSKWLPRSAVLNHTSPPSGQPEIIQSFMLMQDSGKLNVASTTESKEHLHPNTDNKNAYPFYTTRAAHQISLDVASTSFCWQPDDS